jgi:excisionase family DNA binding protein
MEHLTFEQLPEAVSRLLDKMENLERLLLQENRVEDSDEIMNVEQAARYLDLEVPTVYSKVSRRELPFNKPGRHLYFIKSELFQWIQSGRTKTKTETLQYVDEKLSQRNKRGK